MGQEVLTTFDLRMCAPNREPVMNTAELHNHRAPGRHLSAQRAGLEREDHLLWAHGLPHRLLPHPGRGLPIPRTWCPWCGDTFRFIAGYEGEIPGAAAKDCGNYLDQNLPMARFLAKKYLAEALEHPTEKNLNYPE